MFRLYIRLTATFTTLLLGLRQKASQARDERGASALELVVIALGLFLLAGLVIAGIRAAVMSRLGQIN